MAPSKTQRKSYPRKAERKSVHQTYSSLKSIANEGKKKHGKSQNTNESYDGYVRRGKEFLAQFVAEDGCGALCGEDENEMPKDNEKSMDPNFHQAFTGSPIECTPSAIAMFMAHKCFTEQKGKATAASIHAAFLRYYTTLAGDKYRDRWKFDRAAQEWIGNPARSAEVEDMLEACKNKDGEADRTHSRAMSIQDMQKLYDYSQEHCPSFENCGLGSKEVPVRGAHLFFNALASTGFTIWTRNCETTSLQFKNFDFSPPPAPGDLSTANLPYFKVNLRNRKNWQKRTRNGEQQLSGHTYNIYPQPKTPAIDMYTHMTAWLEFYATFLLRRPLEAEDYIFPTIGSNGTSVHPDRPLSSDLVQKRITDMANRAGINGAKYFTTHCFRRGGAQYRFMFAPIHQRWTLARIRWWGGWAIGEHRDTLIRYLLDELYTYEEDHSNALLPQHLGGINQQLEVREPSSETGTSATPIEMPVLSNQVETSRAISLQLNQLVAAAQSFGFNSALRDCQNISLCHERSLPSLNPCFGLPYQSSTLQSHENLPFPWQPVPASEPLVPPIITLSGVAPSPPTVRPTGNSFSNSSVDVERAHFIPEIHRHLGERAWEQVVRDWEEADPSRSHFVALKDWDLKWLLTNKEAVKYGQRRTIAEEFLIRYHRNEATFKEAYPEHKNGITPLLKAIRAQHQADGLRAHRQSRRLHSQFRVY